MGLRGPKPMPPEQLRWHHFGGRLTDAEHKRVLAIAQERSMTIPELCRSVLLGYRLPPRRMPAVNAAEWTKLGRLGNNLNQALRLVHAGRLRTIEEAFLRQLLDEIGRLRQLLQGESHGSE